MSEKTIKVALIAIPNSGKTTLFNMLSKKSYYVSNWPGKTVTVNIAQIRHHNYILEIYDLPGIDSLAVTTKEQKLTKETIMEKAFDIYVIVIDGTSIYRSLYLAIQIREIIDRIVLALNKYDVLESKGIHVNVTGLTGALNAPVIPISALKGYGLATLLDEIIRAYEKDSGSKFSINYGSLENHISDFMSKFNITRGVAIRLIEGDPDYLQKFSNTPAAEEVRRLSGLLKVEYDATPAEIVFIHRYSFLDKVIRENIEEKASSENRVAVLLDKVFLTSPLMGISLGILILFFILTASFAITTGFPLNYVFIALKLESIATILEEYNLAELIGKGVEKLTEGLISLLKIESRYIVSFIIEGVANPLGLLLGFLPLIFILNFLIGMVEDSGILPRIGVAFHSLFKKFGLSGKSLFPLILGYGCNVPGVLTTRILDSDEERYSVIFTMPYVICQARFVVLLLIVSILGLSSFQAALLVLSVYLTSLGLIFITNYVILKKIYKLEEQELLLSLPAYHLPSLRVVWWLSSSRTKHFLLKLFQVIFPASILIWLLSHLSFSGITDDISNSILAYIGSYVVLPLHLIGVNSWEIGVALVNGLFAKELIPSTMVMLHSISEGQALYGLTLPQSAALVFFVSFYTPCLPTLITMWEESKNRALIIAHIVYSLFVALLLSFTVYSVVNIFI